MFQGHGSQEQVVTFSRSMDGRELLGGTVGKDGSQWEGPLEATAMATFDCQHWKETTARSYSQKAPLGVHLLEASLGISSRELGLWTSYAKGVFLGEGCFSFSCHFVETCIGDSPLILEKILLPFTLSIIMSLKTLASMWSCVSINSSINWLAAQVGTLHYSWCFSSPLTHMQIFLSLLWKLIQVNSGPGARNPLTFPKHFWEFYPQELYHVFRGKNYPWVQEGG